jgi:hypothetical protein
MAYTCKHQIFVAKYLNIIPDAKWNLTEALIYLPGKPHKVSAQCLVVAVRTLQLDKNGHHLLLQIVQLCHHTEGYLELSPHLPLITGPVNNKLGLCHFQLSRQMYKVLFNKKQPTSPILLIS